MFGGSSDSGALGKPTITGTVAASSISAAGPSPPALTLAAAKSWLGHAEPGAGVQGLAHAATALTHGSEPELLHLRALNPHVTSALEAAGPVALARMRAPRQLGPKPLPPRGGAGRNGGRSAVAGMVEDMSEAEAEALCGVSAFAFQGTNAHVLLATRSRVEGSAAAAESAGQLAARGCAWRRERHWLHPALTPLLTWVAGGDVGGSIGSSRVILAFETQLSLPQVASVAASLALTQPRAPGSRTAVAAAAAELQPPLLVLPASLLMAVAAAAVHTACATADNAPATTSCTTPEGPIRVLLTSGRLQPVAAAHQQQLLTVVDAASGCVEVWVLPAAGAAARASSQRQSQPLLAFSATAGFTLGGTSEPAVVTQGPGASQEATALTGLARLLGLVPVEAPSIGNAASAPACAMAAQPSTGAAGSSGSSDEAEAPGWGLIAGLAATLQLASAAGAAEAAAGHITGFDATSCDVRPPSATAGNLQHYCAVAPHFGGGGGGAAGSALVDACLSGAGGGLLTGVRIAPLDVAAAAAIAGHMVSGTAAQQHALAVVADEPADDSERCRYVVEWLVEEVVPEQLDGTGDPPAAADAAGSAYFEIATSAAGLGLSDIAGSVAALQGFMIKGSQQQQAQVQQLQLRSCGAHLPAAAALAPPAAGGGSANNAAAAASWALARVLANERSGSVAVTTSDVSAAAAGSGRKRGIAWSCWPQEVADTPAAAAKRASSMYGQTTAGRVAYTARLTRALLPSPQPTPTSPAATEVATATASRAPAAPPLLLPRQGCYLVTGGSGMAAAHVTRWLAEVCGVAHVHLASRTGRLPDASLAALGAAGTPGAAAVSAGGATLITASKADWSSAEDLAWLTGAACSISGTSSVYSSLQQQSSSRPLLGVFHAAGVLQDALLAAVTLPALRCVLAAKLGGMHGGGSSGSRSCHRDLVGGSCSSRLQVQPLATHVMFSSVAALLGSPGQAAYAAANAGLDAAAAAGALAGAPMVSLQFGAWAGAGMVAQSAGTAARLERLGLGLLSPEAALSALSAAVAGAAAARPAQLPAVKSLLLPQLQSCGVIVVNPFRWPAFLRGLQEQQQQHQATSRGAGVPSFFSNFVAQAPPHTTKQRRTAAGAGAAEARPPPSSQRRLLADVGTEVRAAVSAILGAGASEGQGLSEHQPLMEAGLDSLGAVELARSLEARLRLALPQTLVFDHPTVAALTDHLQRLQEQQLAVAEEDLLEEVEGEETAIVQRRRSAAGAHLRLPASVAASAPLGAPAGLASDVVVVQALVQRSPAAAAAATSAVAADPVGLAPFSRWDAEAAAGRVLEARFGAFLPGVDLFDAAAFGISQAEAALMDPQQRLLMEGLHEALVGSASSPGGSSSSNGARGRGMGVYVGVAASDYGSLVKAHGTAAGQPGGGAFHATANALSVTAGRLAYTFGLTGERACVATCCKTCRIFNL